MTVQDLTHLEIADPMDPNIDWDWLMRHEPAESTIINTPRPMIYDTNFQYRPHNMTDVTLTWERHGWVRPDRSKQVLMTRLLNGWVE